MLWPHRKWLTILRDLCCAAASPAAKSSTSLFNCPSKNHSRNGEGLCDVLCSRDITVISRTGKIFVLFMGQARLCLDMCELPLSVSISLTNQMVCWEPLRMGTQDDCFITQIAQYGLHQLTASAPSGSEVLRYRGLVLLLSKHCFLCVQYCDLCLVAC